MDGQARASKQVSNLTINCLQVNHYLYFFQIIYESCQRLCGVNPSKSIAVGDSLHHDIQGSNLVGMDSIFIGGGIHASELGIRKQGDEMDANLLESLVLGQEWRPNFSMSSFIW